MTERIYFKRYDSAGKFPDGRVKLDVHFKDSKGNMYIWTPDWQKGIRALFLEAYGVERLNRLKGLQVEEFKQTAREVSSEVEIESYDELDGVLERLEQGKVVISYFIREAIEEAVALDLISTPSDIESCREETKVPVSIEFRAKIMEEAKNLLNWIKCYKGRSGKWIIVNGELFDVEWEEKIPLPEK